MPATYAHRSFSLKVNTLLESKIQNIINNHLNLYLLGSIGPDPLFYYKPLRGLPYYDLANEIHSESLYYFLFNNKLKDDVSLAYIFGVITHFTLDKNSHEYIHKVSKEGYSHSRMETDLEGYILKLDKLNPLKYNYIKTLKVPYEGTKVMSSFLRISEKDVIKSIKDLRFSTKYLMSFNPIRRFILNFFLKISGKYNKLKDLINHKKITKGYEELVSKLSDIYYLSIKEASNLITNYYKFLFEGVNLDEEFYRTFEGGYIND